MRKARCAVSLLLTILLVFPWFVGIAQAETLTEGPIQSEDNAILAAQLERKAVNYVTKYINTAYQYEEEDFKSGTLLELSNEELAKQDVNSILSKNGKNSIDALEANLQQFSDVANYFKYIRSEQGTVITNFLLDFPTKKTIIDDNYAEVYLYASISFKYQNEEEPSACGDNYIVFFSKIGEEWCIVDIFAEEIEAYRLTHEQFDCAEAIAQFDELHNTRTDEPAKLIISAESGTDELLESTLSGPNLILGGNNRRVYRSDNAIAYAYTYTTQYYNEEPTGNNEAYTNDLFSYYSANCINFASQCVWAGLNGNNYDRLNPTPSRPIVWKNLPMDYDSSASGDSPTKYWYKDSLSWIRCPDFKDYIEASANETTETAVKASVYEVDPYCGFSGVTLSRLIGSVLLYEELDGGDYSPYHAVLITNATGTNRDQVYICANSPMRKNVKLSDSAYSYNKLTLIRPLRLQIEKDSRCAGGHTYPEAQADATKICTQCSVCGYTDLRVIAEMICPISVGTTKVLEAATNYECYCIAINITHTNGTSIWQEFYNTDSIAYSYTFNTKGLYTIYVYARDLNPDIESTTAQVFHVFTIRVY